MTTEPKTQHFALGMVVSEFACLEGVTASLVEVLVGAGIVVGTIVTSGVNIAGRLKMAETLGRLRLTGKLLKDLDEGIAIARKAEEKRNHIVHCIPVGGFVEGVPKRGLRMKSHPTSIIKMHDVRLDDEELYEVFGMASKAVTLIGHVYRTVKAKHPPTPPWKVAEDSNP